MVAGVVHVSELAEGRTEKVEDIVKKGDVITAKCIGVDDKGRIMVFLCHNTDNGDGWEEEGSDPWFFSTFSEKKNYPLAINQGYTTEMIVKLGEAVSTVRAIKELNPATGVELLAPDFNGEPHLLQEVFDSRPEVFAHNVETVPRIFKRIRPAFRYQRSLDVLTQTFAVLLAATLMETSRIGGFLSRALLFVLAPGETWDDPLFVVREDWTRGDIVDVDCAPLGFTLTRDGETRREFELDVDAFAEIPTKIRIVRRAYEST